MTKLGLVLIAVILSACATRPTTHNMPDSSAPNGIGADRNFEVWVDADGAFFPRQWDAVCGTHRSGPYTLHNRAWSSRYPDCTPELLRGARDETLGEIARTFQGADIVTIMIHGFNHGVGYEGDIRHDYAARRRVIDAITNEHNDSAPNHGYIDFFWNGLNARSDTHLAGRFSGITTAWRYAGINAERAGHVALQPMLETLQEAGVQRVHILTQSRGAVVVLAALAGGKYTTRANQQRNERLGVPSPSQPLSTGAMEILVTSTAPAIGRWHFAGGEAAEWTGDQPPRDMPPAVSSYFSTVNPDDFALRKWIGGDVARRFNSTEFGQNLRVAQEEADNMNAARIAQGGEAFMTVVSVNMVDDQVDGRPPAQGADSHNATDYLNLRQVRERLREVYARP